MSPSCEAGGLSRVASSQAPGDTRAGQSAWLGENGRGLSVPSPRARLRADGVVLSSCSSSSVGVLQARS